MPKCGGFLGALRSSSLICGTSDRSLALIAIVAVVALSGIGVAQVEPLKPTAPGEGPAVKPQAPIVQGGSSSGLLGSAAKGQFAQNFGQWDAQAQFLARLPGANLWLTSSGAVYDFRRVQLEQGDGRQIPQGTVEGQVVRMEFVGGLQSSAAVYKKQPGYQNYFLGDDGSRWVSNVPLYGEVRFERIYSGIAARWYFDHGAPRYDLIVQAGVDPAQIAMRFDGANSISTDGKKLVLQTNLGSVEHRGLFAYQRLGNRTVQVPCSMSLQNKTVRFKVGDYDHSRPLIIDPMIWSTYVGGSSNDYGRTKHPALDSAGNIVVGGYTGSADFPVSVGAYQTAIGAGAGVVNGWVGKLTPNGSSLLWATFLGGSSAYLYGLDIDGADNLYVSGLATGTFPTTAGAFDTSYNGAYDAFAAKLSADGASLLWSTYLGGAGNDFSTSLKVDSLGRPVIVGSAQGGFPTTIGSYITSFNGGIGADAFVAKISTDGSSLTYSTYVGGPNNDNIYDVALDASGRPVLVGEAGSGMPVTGSGSQAYHGGVSDAFAARLTSDGSAMETLTYAGGNGTDYYVSVACSGTQAYAAGSSDSSDLTYWWAAQWSFAGGAGDAFVNSIGMDSGGVWSGTFLGGSAEDLATAITLSPAGRIVVVGLTQSANFVTTPLAYDNTHNGGGRDAFVCKLNLSLTSRRYSSFVGGTGDDTADGVIVTPEGHIVVVGATSSSDFPTTAGAYATSNSGGIAAYVFRLSTVINSQRIFTAGDNSGGQRDVPPGLTGVKQLDAGSYHTLALKNDGSVVAWGWNADGQCNVPYMDQACIAVSGGAGHSLALKADGTVVAWGFNGNGECTVPYMGLASTAISAGTAHNLAVHWDGTVTAWGFNGNGECNVPAGLTGVVAVAAGGGHSLALKSDGTVVAWGFNGNGECNVPAGLTGVKAVAAGDYSSIALKSDGTTVSWGWAPDAALSGVEQIDAKDIYRLFLHKSPSGVSDVVWKEDNGSTWILDDDQDATMATTGKDHVVWASDVPYTRGESYSTPVNTQLTVSQASGVLANDEYGQYDTAVLVNPPAHAGAFSLNTDGSFSYTPALGYAGVDSFTYVAAGEDFESTVPSRVVIQVLSKNSAFVEQSVPVSVAAGETFTATVTMRNTGTETWSEASKVRLMSQNAANNTTWGFNRMNIDGTATVPPGATYTFTKIFIAPATPGTYNFQWKAAKDGGGGAFGAATPNIAIVVGSAIPLRNSQFVSQVVPTTLAPGQTFTAKVSMRNLGSASWYEIAQYRLGSQNAANNTTWGSNRMTLPSGTFVDYGSTYQYTKSFTAPAVAGTYNFQWKPIQDAGAGSFGQISPNVPIVVAALSARNAQYVSQSVPTAVAAGSTFTASITMLNIGTETWSEASKFRLMSQNPTSNKTWGYNRMNIGGTTTVPTGISYTFTKTFTAPRTPGIYNFQWKMVNDAGGGGFGSTSANVAIIVY